ncbi:hypothetical protein VP1G_06544 [Cytospora mali]|uniref:BTB domain-containing protein n=1 Tax=Cytospora mali TaxID=578113 RepID=A0A194V5R2_CYTMA|nr:hypothetical protein VP1G_06544 [Valsa mali var. pyri (nom. inval.)]
MSDNIQPGGDVVFVIGAEGRRLCVSSTVLKNSSPVLNSLLGPNFAEGQKLLNEWNAAISLPEDDHVALTIILCVLHGRNDRVPKVFPGDKLCDIAALCDKYDLFVPLKFAYQQWLDGSPCITDSSELWILMSAAYWFRLRWPG